VTLTARRLALFVFAAAGLAFLTFVALSYVLGEHGPIALGYTGMLTPYLLFLLCPILLLDAGVLAIRRRAATIPEVAVLSALVGILLLLGGISWAERFLGYMNDAFYVVVACWLASGLAALASLVVIIVATIAAPRLAAGVMTSAPSTPGADPTP
jgi:hypothetical protein